MIKLFSVKEKQKADAESAASGGPKKQSPGELRLQKDMSELTSIHGVRIDLSTGPDASPLNFTITVAPDEGAYRSGRFVFDVRVSATGYPHEPPKVKCATKVFHPNIDVEGNVCLNILREDWKPVLSISHVAYGLTHLFLDPNPSDPLNKEAAEMLRASPRQFEQAVAMAVSRGAQIGGRYFPPCRA